MAIGIAEQVSTLLQRLAFAMIGAMVEQGCSNMVHEHWAPQ